MTSTLKIKHIIKKLKLVNTHPTDDIYSKFNKIRITGGIKGQNYISVYKLSEDETFAVYDDTYIDRDSDMCRKLSSISTIRVLHLKKLERSQLTCLFIKIKYIPICHLILDKCDIYYNGSICRFVSHNKYLRKLSLRSICSCPSFVDINNAINKNCSLVNLIVHVENSQIFSHLFSQPNQLCHLTKLNVFVNYSNICDIHMKVLGNYLANNSTLKKFSLASGEYISIIRILDALCINTTLKKVRLSGLHFYQDSAEKLSHVIQNNTSLTSLSILTVDKYYTPAYQLFRNATIDISHALMNNNTLQELQLDLISSADEEYKILKIIAMNNVLQKVKIYYSNDVEIPVHIIDLFENNYTICVLDGISIDGISGENFCLKIKEITARNIELKKNSRFKTVKCCVNE